jgi:4-hydroxybenzoate polyprenyltransferase/tetratricopeptide (TPR) repeat protein
LTLRGPQAVIERLETSKIPWGYWLATFLGLVVARNLLEGALGPGRVLGFSYFASPSALMVLDHFQLFYASLFLALALILSSLSCERLGPVMKVMTPAWLLILLPPVLDFLVTRGQGLRITYILDLPPVLLSFFDPRVALERISPGQRVEILAASLLGASYVWLKTKALLRSVGAFAGVYLAIALHGFLPSAFARVVWFVSERAQAPAAAAYDAAFKSGGIVLEESRKLALLFLLTTCALGWAAFRAHAPEKARALRANIRPLRSLHYVGMTIFGIALAGAIFASAGVGLGGAGDFLGVIAVCAAVFFAFQASVLLNDIFDLETDRVSDPGRPLPSGALTRGNALLAVSVFSVAALLFALNVKYHTFLTLTLVFAVSLFYSAPPLRLKRIPVVATFVLGFASLLAALTGFSIIAEERAFALFPPRVAWLLILSFGLAFAAKDLKDAASDRATGTVSLPALLGPRAGRGVTAALVLLGYLLVPALLPYRGLGFVAIAVGSLSAALVFVWRRRVDQILLAVYLVFVLVAGIVIARDVEAVLPADDARVGAKAAERAARIAQAGGDWARAAEGFLTAASEFGDDPQLLELAGVALVASGDPAAAKGSLRRSLVATPFSPIAREYLAVAEIGAGRPAAARAILESAVRERVRPGIFLARLGELELESGDPESARERFTAALRVGEPDVPVRILLGDAYAAAGNADGARREYETTVERAPSSAEAHDALGRFQHAQGDLGRARDELLTATALAPDNALYWNNLGVVYRDLGRQTDALDVLARALRLDPTLVDAYYNCGRVLDAAGRRDEARRQYLLALELDPAFSPARDALEPSTSE